MFEDNGEIAVNPVGTPEEKEKQITFSLSAFWIIICYRNRYRCPATIFQTFPEN